ncbi:BTB/POZ protein, partial [Jimgerdemannia flammicorona]
MQLAQIPSLITALRPKEMFQGSTFVFEWKVEGFKTLKNHSYGSETFWTNRRHPWRLFIHPHGTKDNSKFIAVFLDLIPNDDNGSIRFQQKDVTFAISMQAGDFIHRKVKEKRNFDNKTPYHGFAFASRAEILKALGSENDIIVLTVEIQVPNPTPATVHPDPLASAIAKAFFNNKNTSDVVFHIGDKTFETHSVFLSARSTYFNALFGSGMSETHTFDDKNKMVVHVTDFTYDIFFIMMHYLHTNSLNFCHLPPCTPEMLFMAADKYDVQGLKEAMEDSLIDGLTVDNVVSVLFDHLHSFSRLREAALDFIRDHYEEIQKSGTLEELEWDDTNYKTYAELMKEIVKVAPVSRVKENV